MPWLAAGDPLGKSRAHPPDLAAHIVGDQQAAILGYLDTDRPSTGHIANAEAGQDCHRFARRLRTNKGHEHDLVAAGILTIPRAMLADSAASTSPFGRTRCQRG